MSDSPNRQASVDSRRISIEREIIIRLPAFDTFVTEYSANISTTGMFIKSESPLAAETHFGFEFSVADDWKLITGKGQVVWIRPRDEGPNRPSGMGIRFTDLTAQSRRLIRWIVEKHIREGGTPFELEGTATGFQKAVEEAEELEREREAAPADASIEAPLRGAYGAAAAKPREDRGRKLLIGGGALLLLLTALLVWWPRGEDGEEEAPPAAAATLPPAAAEPTEPPPLPEPSLSTVADSVQTWSSAWSGQNVERYLSSYAATFTPPNGLARGAWEAQRRERLTAPEFIRVAITSLQVEMVDSERATATFFQSYRSNTLSDTVRKRLTLVWESGNWKIEDESVLP